MTALYQFHPIWGLPNASPFCLKVETYLRIAEIPYENHFVSDPRKAPRGKLPFIKVSNKIIPDSEFIIDYLKQDHNLDKQLDSEQQAVSVLLDNVFSERLYWLMVFMRWQDPDGWLQVKKAYFGKLPPLMRCFLPKMIRKKVLKSLYLQGMGRHSREEILKMGYKTLDAIAVYLGDKKYFHGEEVTRIDATAFGFLANIAWLPFADPFKLHLHQHKNLLAFCDRMWSNFYPEMAKPFNL